MDERGGFEPCGWCDGSGRTLAYVGCRLGEFDPERDYGPCQSCEGRGIIWCPDESDDQ